MHRILGLLPLILFAWIAPSQAQTALCRAAISTAEAEYGVPGRLLLGIGRVESGRRDPETGAWGPWPWTINAEGRGTYYPSRDAAIAAVRALQAEGVRSIDIGCMQINLRFHPDAFASLEEAFDPLANARYAARFLNTLQSRAGDWMVAAGHYHSHTPDRADAYRARLAQVLAAEQRRPSADPAPQLAAAPALPHSSPRHGLDLYRSAPIPLVRHAAASLPPARPAAAPIPLPRPAAGSAQPMAALQVAARAPHVVTAVGPAGIANRRLF
ncbi:lytic transglycosylase domain-containing protein [Roseomonas frigidaquae]|uniref:Lytic transglycosylase domain-containing protein n=1 Tax=Falsiroseomonas frigidaquae TaxID=487318 RepID=A0ABX1ERR6_9PROT|nr:lytic transglycosylase domain-containing protein [Falsiroseomonas frigidaquae]NKE43321.1 lytic transglycosylase domain-containing protein [Falsiroseomonas frigidaquae]